MEQVTPFGALASRRHRRPRWLRERAAHKGAEERRGEGGGSNLSGPKT